MGQRSGPLLTVSGQQSPHLALTDSEDSAASGAGHRFATTAFKTCNLVCSFVVNVSPLID